MWMKLSRSQWEKKIVILLLSSTAGRPVSMLNPILVFTLQVSFCQWTEIFKYLGLWMDIFEWRFATIVPWLCHIVGEYLGVWGFETGLLIVWDVENLNLKRRAWVYVKWLLFTLCRKLQYAYKIYIGYYFSKNISKVLNIQSRNDAWSQFYSALDSQRLMFNVTHNRMMLVHV